MALFHNKMVFVVKTLWWSCSTRGNVVQCRVTKGPTLLRIELFYQSQVIHCSGWVGLGEWEVCKSYRHGSCQVGNSTISKQDNKLLMLRGLYPILFQWTMSF